MLYVDHARIPYGRMLMSHLMADTPEELREMAGKLKMERWIQHPGTPKEHLDVSESKREEAIQARRGLRHRPPAGGDHPVQTSWPPGIKPAKASRS